jgi:hypothetical protein
VAVIQVWLAADAAAAGFSISSLSQQ